MLLELARDTRSRTDERERYDDRIRILPLITTTFLATLGACASQSEPELATHEGAVASQEATYDYFDCSNPDIAVGWRFHACTATDAWSHDGVQSGCYTVTSSDCSNQLGTLPYCDMTECETFGITDAVCSYQEWFYSH